MAQMKLHIDAVVSGVRALTPRISEFQLSALDGRPLPAFAPGAHVELHTGDASNGWFVRHYSLIGGTASSYRIAVQREDAGGRAGGSAYIHAHFKLGTRLRISQPIDNFALNRRDSHSLLIAGGIGITPIYAMARSLANRRRSFELVYAGREAAQMAYHDDIAQLAGARARFHYSGRQDAAKLDLQALLAAQPAGATAYVCGPAPMVAATRQAAVAAGWQPGQVRSELFSAGPDGSEVAFDVELRRSGRVVHVAKGVSILDALTQAKADVLWDCRRGECGLCPQDVIEADGPIDHRDRYLSQEERASAGTLCICVSRIRGQRLVLDA